MCGIVGYLGKARENGDILNILKKLEYRGYDSFGLSYIKNKKIIIILSKMLTMFK